MFKINYDKHNIAVCVVNNYFNIYNYFYRYTILSFYRSLCTIFKLLLDMYNLVERKFSYLVMSDAGSHNIEEKSCESADLPPPYSQAHRPPCLSYIVISYIYLCRSINCVNILNVFTMLHQKYYK